MTDIREHPPPATAPAAPAARAMAATGPGRVVGLDGIRGLAALFVVAQPHLRARLAGIPRRQSRPVLGGLADLRPGRGRDVHRPVRLLAGPRPGALGVAVQVDRDVRAPTGLAHPAAVLGRARIQPGDDLVRARPARTCRCPTGSPSSCTACSCRTSSPLGSPQPGVLVDRHRSPALRPAAVAAAARPAGQCRCDGGPGGRHRRDHRRAGTRMSR